ncbi:MAG: hypothetical protein AAF716_13085 [Cyanobacteria bacterium P01_D01_bin.1]
MLLESISSSVWTKKQQMLSAGMLVSLASYSVAPVPAVASTFTSSDTVLPTVVAQLDANSRVVPDVDIELLPTGVVPIDEAADEATDEMADWRSRLTDIETLTLFLTEDKGQLVSASTQLSLTQLSEPTFAWVEDQLNERYGPNKRGQNEAAITQWRAYRTTDGLQYVDVVVNAGLWTQFTYFDRYAFVQQFGEAAIAKGYQLRIFQTDDVDNHIEALTLEENGRDPTIARPVYLRGSYFCSTAQATFADPVRPEPTLEPSFLGDVNSCEVFVTR